MNNTKKLNLLFVCFCFCLCISFSSCRNYFNIFLTVKKSERHEELAKWKYDILRSLVFTKDIKFKINKGEELTRPPGLNQLVLELDILGESGASYKKNCVYYLVPFKNILGALTIFQLVDYRDCPLELPLKDKMKLSLSGIKSLRIDLDKYYLNLKFNFYLNPDEKTSSISEEILLNIPLYNLDFGAVHKKYSSVTTKSLNPGLVILREMQSTHSIFLGKKSDRYSSGTSIRCREIDKECNLVGEDRCHQCAFGHYGVVDARCLNQIGTRFCGPNNCGQKLEPACPRGTQVIDEDSLGICEGNLTPSLNSDQILVCQ